MAIEDYRRLADYESRAVFGAYAHRVQTTDKGRVIPAKESWRQRWVAYRAGYRESSEQNRSEIDRFRQALEKEYGPTIANTISEAHLASRRDRGGNLSSRTVRRALVHADELRLREIRRIKETAGVVSNSRSRRNFSAALAREGLSTATLDQKDSEQIRSALKAALQADDRYGTSTLDNEAVSEIQKSVIIGFLRNRDEARTLREIIKKRPQGQAASDTDRAEAFIADHWGKSRNDPAWAEHIIQIAKSGRTLADYLEESPTDYFELRAYRANLEDTLGYISYMRRDLNDRLEDPDGKVDETLRSMEDVARTIVCNLEKLDVPFGSDEKLSTPLDMEYEAFEILVKELLASQKVESAPGKTGLRQTSISITEDNIEPSGLDSFVEELEAQKNRDKEQAKNMWQESGGRGISASEAETFMRDVRARLLRSARTYMQQNGLPTKNLAELHAQAMLLARNRNQRWDAFSTETRYRDDVGNAHKVITHFTPAYQMQNLQEYYANGERGVFSGAYRKTNHATNLWIDRLASDDGQPICAVVRSGAHSGEQGAREMFLAACEANAEEILRQAEKNPGQPVQVPFVDMGLLSTTVFAKESQHRSSHLKAIRSIQGKEVSFEQRVGMETKIIKVVPRPLDFNFGMRLCDFGFIGQMTSDVYQDERNKRNLQALVGSFDSNHKPGGLVGAFLEGHPQLDPTQRRAIVELVRQVRELYGSRSYRWDDEDQYKFAARICLLAQMIGVMPCIHCKSGKDRTARLVEEVKLLACEIRDSGIVPAPGRRSDRRRERTLAFALTCGNDRIQELNTGYRGNKQYKALNRLIRGGGSVAQRQKEYYRGWEKIAKK